MGKNSSNPLSFKITKYKSKDSLLECINKYIRSWLCILLGSDCSIRKNVEIFNYHACFLVTNCHLSCKNHICTMISLRFTHLLLRRTCSITTTVSYIDFT